MSHPHPRQQAVIDYLAVHGPTAPHVIGEMVFSDTERPARAAQTRLAAMAKDGLVIGEGRMNDRRYDLTPRGRSYVRAPKAPAPASAPVASPSVERDIAAELDAAGVPRLENGRPLSLAARVQRALRERDAADTAIEADLRQKARDVLGNRVIQAVVRAALGREPSPDDLLRVVVEAGVAALTETPTRH